jgi:NADPH2:quinone reductase
MKAAFYERTGPAAEVLQFGDLPDPQPQHGELRVRLRWSGVNPSDVKSRAGLRSSVMPFPRVVPHSDGMGVVDAVGEGVDAQRIGQRVWIWNAAWGRPDGTAAQFVVLPAAQAVPMPDGVPDEAGACFGIPALTALHAVLMAGGVIGKTVLVPGGAGAVGHYAIQFARLAGAAQVIATVSSEAKAAVAREAGADATIRYRDENVAERVAALTGGRGADRVIEVDIAANAAAHVGALANGADWVVYGSGAPSFTLPFFPMISKNVALRAFIVYHLDPADRARAERTLRALLERGALQHRIAERLPLERISEAHHLVEGGRAVGNVVVQIP